VARIAGVDLPKKKRVEYGLTYIYGVGLHTARDVLKDANVDLNKRVYELSDDDVASISKVLRTDKYIIEGDLRKKTAMDIKALMDLGNYRGLRHRKGLPVRGQKTKTNARTRKGRKKTVGSASK
jgi:small subunit ribosomal protein S13